MSMKQLVSAALMVSVTVVGATIEAQQATKVYRVGALFNRAPNQEDRDVELLKEGLARPGYVEGSNLVIEARFAEGNLARLPGFAAELLWTCCTWATRELQCASTSSTTYGVSAEGNPVTPNPKYLQPLVFQPPMSARLGAEITF